MYGYNITLWQIHDFIYKKFIEMTKKSHLLYPYNLCIEINKKARYFIDKLRCWHVPTN